MSLGDLVSAGGLLGAGSGGSNSPCPHCSIPGLLCHVNLEIMLNKTGKFTENFLKK